MNGGVLAIGLDDEQCMDYLRGQGLIVRVAVTPEAADKLLDEMTPDLVIIESAVGGSQRDTVRLIRDLRLRLDDATSIIVISGLRRRDDRVTLCAAGADFLLPMSTQSSELAYEVKRALILRRSGRRLMIGKDKTVNNAVTFERRRCTPS